MFIKLFNFFINWSKSMLSHHPNIYDRTLRIMRGHFIRKVMINNPAKLFRGRMGNPSGEDNLFQTGQGDAVYLDAISSGLNRCSA